MNALSLAICGIVLCASNASGTMFAPDYYFGTKKFGVAQYSIRTTYVGTGGDVRWKNTGKNQTKFMLGGHRSTLPGPMAAYLVGILVMVAIPASIIERSFKARRGA